MSDCKTVVILLSDKRSGSTIFQSELCQHSAIQHVAYSPHTYFETQHWLKAAVLLRQPAAMFHGGKVFPNYGSIGNARTYLIDTILGNVPDFKIPPTDTELVFDGWEAMCRKFAQPVFFEKSPQILVHWAALSLLLEWMKQTSLNVRIIGLVRNPLAVQSSAEKLFGTDPSSRQFGWLQAQTNLLAVQGLLTPEEFMLIRYEDFIADAEGTLSGACSFIGLPAQEALGRNVHNQSAERWKSDPSFALSLHPSVRFVAGQFGYKTAEPPNLQYTRPKHRGSFSLRRWISQVKDRIINRWLKPLKLHRKWKL